MITAALVAFILFVMGGILFGWVLSVIERRHLESVSERVLKEAKR